MNRLIDVEQFRVPAWCVQSVIDHLRTVGTRGLEGFALWAGIINTGTAQVSEAIIPKQLGIRSADGVCVAVDSEELHRINVSLHQRRLRLLVQLHSHPTEAYHSDTDDRYPIATEAGSLSLVIPNFAREGFSLAHIAKYRLSSNGNWEALSNQEIQRLVSIVD